MVTSANVITTANSLVSMFFFLMQNKAVATLDTFSKWLCCKIRKWNDPYSFIFFKRIGMWIFRAQEVSLWWPLGNYLISFITILAPYYYLTSLLGGVICCLQEILCIVYIFFSPFFQEFAYFFQSPPERMKTRFWIVIALISFRIATAVNVRKCCL